MSAFVLKPRRLAVLNANGAPACLDSSGTPIALPILVNQTVPSAITLVRTDLSTLADETIEIPRKECRRLRKQADKNIGRKNQTASRILNFAVRQTGLYRLSKVVDESGLEVQQTSSHMLVVPCPRASIEASEIEKCHGDLSNFHILVDGIPPLKISYSKTVNGNTQSNVLLSVHSDRPGGDPTMPEPPKAMTHMANGNLELSQAQSQRIRIPLNETLGEAGSWTYSIDDIRDSCGNTVRYNAPEKHDLTTLKVGTVSETFYVHERPTATFDECGISNPMKIAVGSSRRLPIWLNPTSQSALGTALHEVTYNFTPLAGEASNGSRHLLERTKSTSFTPERHGPMVNEPGTYALTSVSAGLCVGSILEPSSCLLLNPPEPDLSISHEEIPRACAGDSIGLKVSLDFIGTPPFQVSYNIAREGGGALARVQNFDSMRAHMELKPSDAGRYTYEFFEIMDSVYKKPRPLRTKQKLQQDVKPTALATFASSAPIQQACIGEAVALNVDIVGDSPWKLEYDIVHNGKRNKHNINNVTSTSHMLHTPRLSGGGLHTVTLTAVTDASGCRISLQEQAPIHVRHQRPSASFGVIEGQRRTSTLEGRTVDVPVRLSGEGPWSVRLRRTGRFSTETFEKILRSANDFLSIGAEGLYEILEVHDSVCPGSVDDQSSSFELTWEARPTMAVSQSNALSCQGTELTKEPVCEGDSDMVEVTFTGVAPYTLRYDVEMKAGRGSTPVRTSKKERFALSRASIGMDTLSAGSYIYRFKDLGDQLYDHGGDRFTQMSVHQLINPRPWARFQDAGKVYSYCHDSKTENEGIPVQLTGTPPFAVEIYVRHHSSTKSETVSLPRVNDVSFRFHVPLKSLALGSHTVSVKSVRDRNGCQSAPSMAGSSVRINVAEAPTISPAEVKRDYCIGERISFSLVGTPPFTILYTFEGIERRASASSTVFRRIAEKPGDFTITAVGDKANSHACYALNTLTKVIHPLPSVQISRGRTTHVDIHEGGHAEIRFDFGGTPPFHFT